MLLQTPVEVFTTRRPQFLSGTMTILLKPWFTKNAVSKGFDLLKKGGMKGFLCYRNSAGATFVNGVYAVVNIVPSDKLSQGFVCKERYCSGCKADIRGNHNCRHTAAVMLMASFHFSAETDGGLPHPLSFSETLWHKIGRFLFSMNEYTPITIALLKQDDSLLLQSSLSPGFALSIRLSAAAGAELHALHPGAVAFHDPACPSAAMFTDEIALMAELTARSRSRTEAHLVAKQKTSRGEMRDRSVWMHLCRLLDYGFTAGQLSVTKNSEGLFSLTAQDGFFSLTLPRQRTVELLQYVQSGKVITAKLPPAESFSKCFFNSDNNSIEVEHRVRLQDGQSFSRRELAPYRYGNFYYLDGFGFFNVKGLPAAEEVSGLEQPQASLFSLADDRQGVQCGFTIPQDDIPRFLQKNSRQMQSGRHEIAPDVREMQIVDEPERVELTFFQEDHDWCYLAGYYDLGNQKIDLIDLIAQAEARTKHVPGKKWLRLHNTPLAWFHNIGVDRIVRLDGNACVRLRAYELLALSRQVCEIKVAASEKRMSRLLDSLLHAKKLAMPACFSAVTSHLREYQRAGVAWLLYLTRYQLGGILADDMGLGKTHQALALINCLLHHGNKSRFLVVCPSAVLINWVAKANKFFPALDPVMYYGHGREQVPLANASLLVTTYGVLRNDIDVLGRFDFETVFFDEMQQLKNSNTLAYKAAGQLKSKNIIGLTGTPIENSLLELQALFDICLPGLFRNKEFFKRYIRDDSSESRKELSGIVRPFILRRTRGQVLKDLPPVIDDIRLCDLHDDQVGLYRRIIEDNQAVVAAINRERRSGIINILALITRLKQLCNHPCLLSGCRDPNEYGSGKWELWREIMDECLSNSFKVVIFSQYTSMLDLMRRHLDSLGVGYCTIRGSMAPRPRQQAIDRFAADKTCLVCLASLLAGGVGIDLTAAQVVIHYDRWWNPAKEEQATARVHRLGQEQVVQVIKLITRGTLEEKLHMLLLRKQKLAEDIIVEDDASIIKNIHHQELAGLFSLPG